MLPGSANAHAKLILLGEHFVVSGAPALAAPLPALTLSVRLAPGDGAGLAPHVRRCLEVCHEVLGGPGPDELRAEIISQIPQRIGLGSSAALAVAIGRARLALAGREAAAPALLAIAERCERIAHGRPSGVDTAAVLATSPLRFQPGRPTTALAVGEGLAFVVLDLGRREASSLLVARAQRWRAEHPGAFRSAASELRGLVELAAAALAAGDAEALGEAMTRNQQLLRPLGVSSPAVERGLTALRDAGAAGSKLTGAGGGGALFGVLRANELDTMTETLRAAGHPPVATWRPTPTERR